MQRASFLFFDSKKCLKKKEKENKEEREKSTPKRKLQTSKMVLFSRDQQNAADGLASENLESGSQSGYRSKLKAFEAWLREEEFTSLITPEPGKLGYHFNWTVICEAPEDGKKSFAATLFHEYAANFKRKSGNMKPVSKSHMTGVRSALQWCCGENNFVFPRDFTQQTKKTLRAVGKRYAKAKRAGEVDDNARRQLDFKQYYTICKLLWQEGTMEAKELNAFIQAQWNISCRGDSIATLSLPSIKAFNDAIQVMIFVSKTNQEGEDLEARHIYFNPLAESKGMDMRYVDVGSALGAYLLAYPDRRRHISLFYGNSKERIKKSFAALLLKYHELLGIKKEDLHFYGLHSIRKGAGTYCTSGSVGGPSMVSVGRRMEHNMGIQNVYLKYEHAGDQFVGRVVAGLPLDSPDFDILPPSWSEIPSNLNEHLELIFGQSTVSLSRTSFLRRILANLVYHSDWLKARLSANDVVLQNHLFRTRGLLALLQPMVKLGGGGLTSTGVPTTTAILRGMTEQMEKMNTWKSEILTAIEKVAQGNGTITAAFIQTHITSALDTQLEAMTSRLSALGFRPSSANETESNEQTRQLVHFWPPSAGHPQGKYHFLPRDYRLPSCGVKTALQLWLLGNENYNIAPLRDLKQNVSLEFSLPNEATKFFEWKTCMVYLERLIVSKWPGDLPSKFDPHDVEKAWNLIKNDMGIPASTRKGKRNLAALKVATVKKLLVEAGKITLKRTRRRRSRRSKKRTRQTATIAAETANI